MKEMGDTLYLILLIIVSILSLAGSGYLIFQYFKQRPNANFALKLLAILNLSDVVYWFALLIDPSPQSDNGLCVFQAYLKQSAGLSIFIVNFFLCYTTYLSIVEGSEIDNLRYINSVKALSIPFPLILALIPLTYQGYGFDTYACSFRDDNLFWISGVLFFYLPFITLLFASVYFVWRIFRFLKDVQLHNSNFDDLKVNRITLMAQKSQLSEVELYTRFLLYYTLVHLICWLPQIIYQIIYRLSGTDFLWLDGLRYIAASGSGFFNGVLFFISKTKQSSTKLYDVRQSVVSDQSSVDIYRGSVAVYNSSL